MTTAQGRTRKRTSATATTTPKTLNGDLHVEAVKAAAKKKNGVEVEPGKPVPTRKAKPELRTWRDTITVHPAANAFRMFNDQEKRDLLADIKRTGCFLDPVRVWKFGDDWYLLDGRNRLDCWEQVHKRPLSFKATRGKPVFIDPEHEEDIPLEAVDATPDEIGPYVRSVNKNRRHQDAAERAREATKALRAATAFNSKTTERSPVPNKGGRGHKGEAARVAEAATVDKKTAQAQLDVAADPVLDAKVEAGEISAAEAGRIIRERKKAERNPLRTVESSEQLTTVQMQEMLQPFIDDLAARAKRGKATVLVTFADAPEHSIQLTST